MRARRAVVNTVTRGLPTARGGVVSRLLQRPSRSYERGTGRDRPGAPANAIQASGCPYEKARRRLDDGAEGRGAYVAGPTGDGPALAHSGSNSSSAYRSRAGASGRGRHGSRRRSTISHTGCRSEAQEALPLLRRRLGPTLHPVWATSGAPFNPIRASDLMRRRRRLAGTLSCRLADAPWRVCGPPEREESCRYVRPP
jgi:hypothetical protein